MFNSGDFSQDRTILKAIVSLFFNLDNNDELIVARSALISELLKNLLGNTFAPRLIVELAENPYPIRQSVNIINQEFSYCDKFVLLLNIFYFSHVNKINKSVNGCIDLVKIVDILRMNISLYDTIFDFLEGRLEDIPLDKENFSQSLPQAKFTNYLIICHENGDIDIKREDICLCFIKITEDKIYKVEINKKTNSSELTSFADTLTLELENPIIISERFIKNAFSQKLNQTSELIELQELPEEVFYRKHNHIYLLNIKNKKQKNFLNNSHLCYIDAPLTAESNILGIEVFNQRKISQNSQMTLYIIDYGNELIVTEKRLEKSIALLKLENGEIELETLSPELLVNSINQKGEIKLKVNEDVITWKTNSYKFSLTGELIASNISFSELNVKRVKHSFKDSKNLALSDINFSLKNGELLAIMGPSGSGKTTLLKVLNGEMKANEVDISIDGLDFMDNFNQIIKNVGYVPQSDLLFSNLTVYQNIFYYAKVRTSGNMKGLILRNKIERVLKKVGLFEKRNHVVGTEEKKVLSGGERRRLNIALELIFEPAIIILDEPTSGLSSKDSEQILSILRDLANNGKMIITTIHQPNPKIFASFDKLLFLDRQGVVVYFGDAVGVFDYFGDELKQIIIGKEEIEKKRNLMMVDFIFDILEYKGYSNATWTKEDKRFFPPDHWITKRDRFLIGDLMTKKDDEKNYHRFTSQTDNSFKDNFNQFYYCLRRNIINTLFSKINLIMLLFVPLVLGFFCAILLKNSEVLPYSFGHNDNIPIFNFISILVFIFLGMAGSLYDIQPEKLIIVREKKVGLLASNYLLAKVLTLLSFTIIQVIIYTLVAQEILEFKGHFTIYFMLLTLSGFCGISIGLFASASIPDKRGLLMTLPLALIPMIIFGGAIIPFSTMNPSLTISSQREVPEFCELIPTKWLFEALTLTSIHENSYSRHIANFDSLLSKTDGADKKSQINDQKYDFLMSRNRDEYINRMNEKLADQAYIKYLNKKGNYYLSEKYPIFNKELKSSSLAIIMSIVLSLIFNGLTLLKIKEF